MKLTASVGINAAPKQTVSWLIVVGDDAAHAKHNVSQDVSPHESKFPLAARSSTTSRFEVTRYVGVVQALQHQLYVSQKLHGSVRVSTLLGCYLGSTGRRYIMTVGCPNSFSLFFIFHFHGLAKSKVGEHTLNSPSIHAWYHGTSTPHLRSPSVRNPHFPRFPPIYT